MLTVKEFAKAKNMSVRSIQQHIHRGNLPAIKETMGNQSRYLIGEQLVDTWKPAPAGRPPKLSDGDKKEIARLRNVEKWTLLEIADVFEISESYVSMISRGER